MKEFAKRRSSVVARPDDKSDVLGGKDAAPAEFLPGLHATVVGAKVRQAVSGALLNGCQIPQLLHLYTKETINVIALCLFAFQSAYYLLLLL